MSFTSTFGEPWSLCNHKRTGKKETHFDNLFNFRFEAEPDALAHTIHFILCHCWCARNQNVCAIREHYTVRPSQKEYSRVYRFVSRSLSLTSRLCWTAFILREKCVRQRAGCVFYRSISLCVVHMDSCVFSPSSVCVAVVVNVIITVTACSFLDIHFFLSSSHFTCPMEVVLLFLFEYGLKKWLAMTWTF